MHQTSEQEMRAFLMRERPNMITGAAHEYNAMRTFPSLVEAGEDGWWVLQEGDTFRLIRLVRSGEWPSMRIPQLLIQRGFPKESIERVSFVDGRYMSRRAGVRKAIRFDIAKPYRYISRGDETPEQWEDRDDCLNWIAEKGLLGSLYADRHFAALAMGCRSCSDIDLFIVRGDRLIVLDIKSKNPRVRRENGREDRLTLGANAPSLLKFLALARWQIEFFMLMRVSNVKSGSFARLAEDGGRWLLRPVRANEPLAIDYSPSGSTPSGDPVKGGYPFGEFPIETFTAVKTESDLWEGIDAHVPERSRS